MVAVGSAGCCKVALDRFATPADISADIVTVFAELFKINEAVMFRRNFAGPVNVGSGHWWFSYRRGESPLGDGLGGPSTTAYRRTGGRSWVTYAAIFWSRAPAASCR